MFEKKPRSPRHKGRKRILKKVACRLCGGPNKIQVDYKNIPMLQRFVTPQGKLYGRKRLGTCAMCQNKIKSAVKRARFIALLPFVSLY
jgi:small subunit ribosomal protein S18